MARLLAIDLGADAVKISVFQGSAGQATLETEVQRRVPQDGTGAPTIADRLAVLDLLLSEHPALKAGAHLTGLVWPSSRVAVRRMKLPFTDPAQVAQTLPFAIEAEVPFDLDEMVLAWRPSEEEGTLLVTLAGKAPLQEAVAGLAARGLDPKHVLPDGGLLGAYAPDDVPTAVIDVGHEHTTVVVARGGRALLYRSLGVAGRTLTRVIADALGCSWAEAEVLKHGGDLSGDDDDTVGGPLLGFDEPEEEPTSANDVTAPDEAMPDKAKRALDGAIGLLLAEIRSTLVQAEDDLGVGVEQVVLVGGASRVESLQGWLEQDLGVPVRRPVDEAGVPVRAEWAVNRALGRHIASDGLPDLTELRLGELAWRGGLGRTRDVVQGIAFFLAAFSVFVVLWTGWNVWKFHQQRQELDERIRTALLEAAPEGPADLDATGAVDLIAGMVEDARTEAEFLGDAGAAPPTVDLLYQLTKAFPAHPDVVVNVDELDISPGGIQIQGVTDGFAQVDQIGQSLQDVGGFPKVVATPGNKDSSGKLAFTVEISREVVEGEDVDGEGADSDAATGEEG